MELHFRNLKNENNTITAELCVIFQTEIYKVFIRLSKDLLLAVVCMRQTDEKKTTEIREKYMIRENIEECVMNRKEGRG